MGGAAKVGRAVRVSAAASRRRRAAPGACPAASQVLVPATLVLALAMGFAQPSWAGAAVAPAGNLITPDGRTATTVAALPGQVTNISTATVRAGVGYNSFSRFVVGAGNQVNLLVPAQAGTLLNVVRDGAVDIEGALSSYKNGALGGNVVFADPDGLIVGRSGVVDVGGFTVVTPTSAVLEQLIGASGAIDGALSQRLLAGDVPLSPDGSVLIQGRVQARGGVQIYAHDVLVAAASAQAPSAAQHDALFQSTVNTQGLVQGGSIVASGGSIRIVAAQDATIGGTLSAVASKTTAGSVSVDAGRDLHLSGSIAADGAPGVNAGSITLHAGRDIDVAASSVLSAAGAGAGSDGGAISVKADHDLQVASGTTLLAQAGSSGDAGRIELSAQDTATLGSLHVDLGATAGRAGSLLIDPIDLVIDGSNDSPYTTDGGNVSLLASRSITVATGGVIDTEVNGGTGGGNISLSAPSITVQGGASLLAGTGAGAGSIQLLADASPSTSAQISIGDTSGQRAVLEGGDISLQATSQLAQSSYDHAVVIIQNADLTANGTLGATAIASGGQQLTAIGAAASADVLASVRILGDANLSSSGAMNLSAQATAAADSTAALPVALSLPADAAAAVNQVSSVSTVEVGGSSTLNTTGTGSLLSLGASNTVSSNATADASGASAGASVAVNIVRVQTTAEIDGSASVHSAGDLDLSGTTTLAMSTAATASQGGASSTPDSGSQAAQYLSDPSYTPYLSTSDGSVGAAAALAISDLQSATSVDMSSTHQATAAGQISLQGSAANGASANADGSPAGDSTSRLGIGAAVALNLAQVSDDASVAQDLQAGSLDLSATMSGGVAGNAFSAQAVSGAGASNVGVAGSLATDLLDSEAEARVKSGTLSLTGGSGAVQLSSDDLSSSTVAALPEGAGASGGKVGVGASVGLNIV
ncbi:MAG: leukotoxin LktA family filamentous adhesin, partial [Betaproteobacteria bacterium]|nr:leukotoxin LktA family filamentous adhesin [Betaproteobacteria bacterium]